MPEGECHVSIDLFSFHNVTFFKLPVRNGKEVAVLGSRDCSAYRQLYNTNNVCPV